MPPSSAPEGLPAPSGRRHRVGRASYDVVDMQRAEIYSTDAATQIEPRRMWRITCDLLLTFFATHVCQEGIPGAARGTIG